ncbi:MAG: LysR family transcriptional regulator [Proteobacteria bacterium]|nr:LysR family transcriptional regulator [Pseudomonadota bacterium]
MDLKGVRTFCAVAAHGSFGRAAVSLGVVQSVLSRQISALEGELGGRLFHRTGRGVQLTQLGLAVLPRAKALLAEAEQLLIEARGERSSPAGTVDLGVVPGWTQPLVSILVSRLLAEFPRIRLRAHEAYSGQVEDWVATGRIDVAVFNRYRRGAVRDAEAVSRADMMLVGRKGHPLLRRDEVPFKTLAEIPLCVPLSPNGLTSVMNEIAAHERMTLNIVFEGGSSSILREAVARCGLFTLFPRPFVERELARSTFRWARLVKPTLTQITWISVGTQRPATQATRTVAQLARQILKGHR